MTNLTNPTNPLAIREGVEIKQNEPLVQNITALARHFIQSGYFRDATDISKAVVKILAGREIGIGPFTAMTGINIVEGHLTLSANLIAAQIKRHGRYNFTIKEHSDQICVLEFFEDGEKVGESSFSMDDGRKIVRNGKPLTDGDNWKNYPRNMLFARAVSNGAKWFCPDVFGGTSVYTPEELDVPIEPQTGEIIQFNTDAANSLDNLYHCDKHNATWTQHIGKDGKSTWYSHKQGSGWCNMKDFPIATKAEQSDETYLAEKARPYTQADAQEVPQDTAQVASPAHAATEEPVQPKGGPSGEAAAFEALVARLPRAKNLGDLWTNGLKLGYPNKAAMLKVTGPESDIADLALAFSKLVQHAPVRTAGLLP